MPAPAQRPPLDGLLFAAATFLTWGMVGVWVRLLPLPALFIVGLRMLIAFAALLPFVLLSGERRSELLRTARLPLAWLLAAALTAYYSLAVAAFQFGAVAEVALFVGTSPAFILITRLVRRQPISSREITGAAIAAIGVAAVLGPKLSLHAADSRLRLFGDFLALASAAMSALYAGTYREIHERRLPAPDPISVAILACSAGGTLLAAAMTLHSPELWSRVREPRVAIILLVLGLLSTAVPSVAYALAARKLPAILSTTSQLMIPVIAAVAAAIVLHEFPPTLVYVGGALVLYGIIHMMLPSRAPFEEGEAPLVD